MSGRRGEFCRLQLDCFLVCIAEAIMDNVFEYPDSIEILTGWSERNRITV